MKKQHRLKPAIRKEEIISAALELAEKSHYQKITRNQIAKAAGVTGPAVQYHFKTMTQIRRDIMRAAVKQERLRVIAQGLVAEDHRAVSGASPELKKRALDALA